MAFISGHYPLHLLVRPFTRVLTWRDFCVIGPDHPTCVGSSFEASSLGIKGVKQCINKFNQMEFDGPHASSSLTWGNIVRRQLGGITETVTNPLEAVLPESSIITSSKFPPGGV